MLSLAARARRSFKHLVQKVKHSGIFRNTNIDFLGKKCTSSASRWCSACRHTFHDVLARYSTGRDFRGGTLVYVKFVNAPNIPAIRSELDKAGLHNAVIQSLEAGSNEVVIKLDLKEPAKPIFSKGKKPDNQCSGNEPRPG